MITFFDLSIFDAHVKNSFYMGIKVTLNLHFLADQDFQGSLSDSLPNINSIPLKMAN